MHTIIMRDGVPSLSPRTAWDEAEEYNERVTAAKSQLKSRGTDDLFWCLRRLYHHRICTTGPCPICSGASRSGEICAKCIGQELQDRGAKLGKVDELLQCRQEMQELMRKLEDAEKYVAHQIENKARGA